MTATSRDSTLGHIMSELDDLLSPFDDETVFPHLEAHFNERPAYSLANAFVDLLAGADIVGLWGERRRGADGARIVEISVFTPTSILTGGLVFTGEVGEEQGSAPTLVDILTCPRVRLPDQVCRTGADGVHF